MSKKDIIVFDLDGTLSLVGDRVKYLQQEPKDWDLFYNACGEDKINFPIFEILIHLKFNYEIRIVTGRREGVKVKTLKWLEANGLCMSGRHIFMRKNGDFRHDTIVKPELIGDFKDRILMIFEDRKSMVDKWRELGFTCLQVAEGNF